MMSFEATESFWKGALIGGIVVFVSMLAGSFFGATNLFQPIMGFPLILWSLIIGVVVGGIVNLAMRS